MSMRNCQSPTTAALGARIIKSSASVVKADFTMVVPLWLQAVLRSRPAGQTEKQAEEVAAAYHAQLRPEWEEDALAALPRIKANTLIYELHGGSDDGDITAPADEQLIAAYAHTLFQPGMNPVVWCKRCCPSVKVWRAVLPSRP